MNKEALDKIEALRKEIDGLGNTIWALKFETSNPESEHTLSMIALYEERIRIEEAKIKAIELQDKLK